MTDEEFAIQLEREILRRTLEADQWHASSQESVAIRERAVIDTLRNSFRASKTITVPQDWVESVSALKFPESTDRRLRELMDLNNEGRLKPTEKTELEALVELSEELSLVRAQAFRFLERKPT